VQDDVVTVDVRTRRHERDGGPNVARRLDVRVRVVGRGARAIALGPVAV
jgi:hypothetical protein